MSVFMDRKNVGKPGYRFHVERYESAQEVAQKCTERTMTNPSFNDATQCDGSWCGVKNYEEALNLLRNGYQPTVEAMRGVFNGTNATQTRFKFQNAVAGFAPIVPLALIGVPTNMIDMRMTPIKAKVIDVYYDMTNSCATSPEDIIKAGQILLATIIDMERQGYRFNLYACQTYSNNNDCDMLVVKVKSAGQPLDLKRVSFPLTHTAFFRVIGFDWYSKVPGGTYRSGYGRALGHTFDSKKIKGIAQELFGKTAVYFVGKDILNKGEEGIKEAISNGNSETR